MDKVLVLGEDSRSFLAVVRSLGRGGLEVHAATSAAAAPALTSRFLRRVHRLPEHDAGPEVWRAALTAVLQGDRFDLVLPCSDGSILPLHAHRAALSALAPLYLLSEEAQETTSDKGRTAALGRSLGVPVPREIIARDPRDGAAALRAFGLPLVVKPRRSFRLGALGRKQLVRTVTDEAALGRLLAALTAEGEVLLQEHVPGVGVGVEALAWEGEVLLPFQHVRVHEPPGGGGSSYRRSAPLHPGLLAATHLLLRALRYTGVAMVEFRLDPGRGTFTLLEINGRFWGSLPLAVAAGADFPLHLYEMLVRGRRRFPQGYRVGLHARSLSGDLGYLWQTLRARDLRALARVPLEARHVLCGRERIDTLTRDDPAPALAELLGIAGQVARALGARAAAALSRRRGGRVDLRAARTLLFVCKGNICRSPFAAVRAAALLPHLRVLSAGYAAVRGRRCAPAALAAAAAAGADLGAHRARLADEALLQQADVILVFDEDCFRALWARHPGARARLLRLAPLAGAAEVADPDGGTATEFSRCYALIERALEELAGRLTGPAAASLGAAPPASPGAASEGPPPPPAVAPPG